MADKADDDAATIEWHEFHVKVPVDTEALAGWVDEKSDLQGGPYSTDPSEWDGDDLFRAAERGIIDSGESEMTGYSSPEELSA